MPKLSKAELAKRKDVIQKMKKNKRSLVKRYGPDAEKVMYGRATNIAKKVAETQMKNLNLKELVRAALMNEKAGFTDEFDNDPALKGGQKNLPDGLQKAIISKVKGKIKEALNQAVVLTDEDHDMLMKNGSVRVDVGGQTVVVALKDFQVDLEDADYEDPRLEEDLDLGHEDNEPHMIKGELYRIGKYAMELYNMVDQFEGRGEVDFPAWWQSKITTAKNMVSSAKHYLEFELKEPEIDAMVSVATGEDIIPNTPSVPLEDEIEEGIHDKDITSASHTNVKGEMGAYNPEKRKASLKKLAKFGLEKNDDEIEEGLPKGYWSKKIEGGIDESYEALVKKLKGQGKSEKAAKAIAGAVASYKAKGGGKGPTAKQKARG